MNGFAEFHFCGSDEVLFIRPESVDWFHEDRGSVVISSAETEFRVKESLSEVCETLEVAAGDRTAPTPVTESLRGSH